MPSSLSLTPVVELEGQKLAEKWLSALVELRVERQYQVPTRVTMRFSDFGYELLSSPTLRLGHAVKVSQHGGADLAEAEITSIGAEQRPGDNPEIVVVALDKSHRLGRATQVKVYKASTYSDIVSKMAQDAGLTPSVDSTTLQLEYLMQAESDLVLLTELARRTGFDWWMEGSKLHFAKPAKKGDVTLTLGDTLLSFSARVSGVTPSEVKVDGWDRTKQESVSSSASSADVPKASSDLADLLDSPPAPFGSATVFSAGLGVQSSAEAEALAKSVYNRAVTSAVTAKGVAYADAAITLGATAVIKGAGPLSGSYPITEVEHVFRPASGFVTRFVSGERRPTTLVDTLGGLVAAPAGAYTGPAHLRTGVTVGVVTNNNDPSHSGRVKVRFPGLSQNMESDWARVVSVGGGAKRGSVWIPEIDDEVLVAFEGGDARQPVVIGGLYGQKSTMPVAKVENSEVQTRAMTSRLGHVISFLDGTTPATEAVEIVLAGEKHKIHLGKDKLAVTVPSGTPVEVTAGNTSLKFSNSGDITLEATNITIKATNELKLQAAQASVQAQATLDIKANAKLGVSGGILEMQSNGPAKLAGTPVMIN